MTTAMRVSASRRRRCADPVSAAHPRFIPGLGLCAPYRWAHYARYRSRVPTAVAESRVALVTTRRLQPARATQGPVRLHAPRNSTRSLGDSAADHDLRIAAYRLRPRPHDGEDGNTGFRCAIARAAAPPGSARWRRASTAETDRTAATDDDRPGWSDSRAVRADRSTPYPRRGLNGVHQTVSLAPSPRSQRHPAVIMGAPRTSSNIRRAALAVQ